MPDDAAEYVEEVQKLYGQDGIYRSFPVEPLSCPIGAKSDLLTRHFGDTETGVAAVTFVAAALWLFLDLNTPGVKTASSYRLAEQVESLASVIRNLTRRLRASTKELARLTANRPSGALAERPGNKHLAPRITA
jgi:hypothetical protein